MESEEWYLGTSFEDVFEWIAKEKEKTKEVVLGWVGNSDRSIKNFETILVPLRDRTRGVKFDVIATKKDKATHNTRGVRPI